MSLQTELYHFFSTPVHPHYQMKEGLDDRRTLSQSYSLSSQRNEFRPSTLSLIDILLKCFRYIKLKEPYIQYQCTHHFLQLTFV